MEKDQHFSDCFTESQGFQQAYMYPNNGMGTKKIFNSYARRHMIVS
jgi:hypothetical protein